MKRLMRICHTYWLLAKHAESAEEAKFRETRLTRSFQRLFFGKEPEDFKNALQQYKDAPDIEYHLKRFVKIMTERATSIKGRLELFLPIVESINPSWRQLVLQIISDNIGLVGGKLVDMEDALTDKELKSLLAKLIKQYIDNDAPEKAWEKTLYDLSKSSKISQLLIKRLMRNYAPGLFASKYKEDAGYSYKDDQGHYRDINVIKQEDQFKAKEKYNVDDILFFIDELFITSRITFDDLVKIYQKSSPPAQNILRSILYIPINGREKDFFLLTHDLEPLGMDNVPIKITPEQIPLAIIKDPFSSPFDPEIKQKWADIFADYRLAPYYNYFHDNEEDN